jgi:DNA ligase-1
MLFEELAECYSRLEATASRLQMIDILTDMLSNADLREVRGVVYMTQGVLAPPFTGIKIGIADKFAEEAIALATGYEKGEVVSKFKEAGDLGTVAEEFAGRSRLKRMGKEQFDVKRVYDTIFKIANISGQGSQETKIRLLSGLLAASEPVSARYIIRFTLGKLRLGLGDATILEALSKWSTGGREFRARLENAYNMCSDLGRVAYVLRESGTAGIDGFRAELFSPIRPALAERLPSTEEIIEKMHGLCSVEAKYDGMRVQVHINKVKGRVEIFSRNQERLTDMFPEIVRAALNQVNADGAIIEGEAMSYEPVSETFYPFQETMQRKRKHSVEEMSKEIPLTMFAFDILYVDGSSLMDLPYSERSRILEKTIKKGNTILLAEKRTIKNAKALDRYFEDAVGRGLEGIIAKDPDAKYIAGARKFSWVKLKRSYKGELSDTLDLVIVGYYLGKGMRAELGFGGLLCATYNAEDDTFETITRIGTGFTEVQMSSFKTILDQTKSRSKPARVVSEVAPDHWVTPRYVITVNADEITRSPMHTCGRAGGDMGYALRFPRIVSDTVRDDKDPEQATSTDEIIKLYGMQKKVSNA